MKRSKTDKKPFNVGLTGGIASGKTTVSKMFADLGVPIIDTDMIAREVVEPGQPAIEEIKSLFDDSVFDESGHLDRAALRKLIFLDSAARLNLEAILHPRIAAEVRRQSESVEGTYQIIAVPLLVGSALLQFVDRVVVVDCSEDKQIERLLKRDSGTVDEAKRILANQSSREERLAIADDIILNDSDLRSLRKQVIVLHEKYLRQSVL